MKNFLLIYLLAGTLSYVITLLGFLFYKGFSVETAIKTSFSFVIFIIAPILSFPKNPIVNSAVILIFSVAFFFVYDKLEHEEFQFVAVIFLFLIWEIYGVYCSYLICTKIIIEVKHP